MINRRRGLTTIASAIAGFLESPAFAKDQEVVNGLQIVSTGDVHVGQHAAGTPQVYIDSQGNVYYARSGATHVVENNGQVVATGDVWIEQEAAGSQEVTAAPVITEVATPYCIPGVTRRTNLNAGGESPPTFSMQGLDCQWYAFPAAAFCHCPGK